MDLQKFWNEKYKTESYFYGTDVNDYLKERLVLLEKKQKKRLLELACGEGRNSVWCALQGFEVSALDVSDLGLKKVLALAKQHAAKINTLHSDIFEYNPENSYDIVIATYLHMMKEQRQKLYAKVYDLLAPNGIFVAEWYHPNQRDHGYTSGGPPSAEMMITLNELESYFNTAQWQILDLHYQLRQLTEGSGHVGLAAVVQITAEKRG